MRTFTLKKEGGAGPSEPILATKLLGPRPRPDLVSRPHLLARLDEGLSRRLTVVSASAGFGKTMLLSEWCAQLRSRKVGVVWLSLDEDDNDPTRLWVYLIRTLGALKEGLAEDVLSFLVSPSRPPLDTVITALINDLAAIEEDFVCVLDDYHIITAESIHSSLAFLIEHEPPQMHLVIAGRTDPPLPLARLRGSGQLVELGVADLRFTLKETTEFLKQSVDFTPSEEDIAALHARTEGWVAGLQMAALSMRGQEAGSTYIASFAGDDRNIRDYLLEEVLLKQPEDTQTFLLKTSVLDRVSGPLCDALTGRADGQERLEALERANLFIASLDTRRQWYRYHRLFLDLLRQRLAQVAPGEIPKLHLRAAEWFADHDLLDEALGHGMASGDYQRLIHLLERAGWPMLMHGEVNLLLECLEALPEEMVRSRPRLNLYHAWALLRATQFDEVEKRLNDAEKGLGAKSAQQEEGTGGESPLKVRSMLGAVAALRASLATSLGDTSRTIALSHKALEYLSDDDPVTREATRVLRGIVSRNLGDAHAGKEDLEAAVRAQTEAIALSQSAGDLYEAVLAASRLGTLYELKGQLRQAARTYQEALKMAAGSDGQPLSVSALVQVGLGEVLREWNELDAAESHVRQAIATYRVSEQPIFLPQSYVLLARVQHARGDTGGALKTLTEARQLALEQKYVRAVGYVLATQARIWIDIGHLEAAEQWAEEAGLTAGDDLRRLPFRTLRHRYVTLARLHMARDGLGTALELLERLRALAEAAGRMGGLIEILVCQAMAQQKQGRQTEAVVSLKRALTLGEPEGFVRTFADEGASMARLLARVMKEQGARTPYTSYAVLADYVGRLMAALEPDLYTNSEKTGAPQPLLDPLSDRELEVLKLLAAGMSNREIGERLFVAVNTIKTHIRNIYSKLYVRNRTQAMIRAQELNLL